MVKKIEDMFLLENISNKLLLLIWMAEQMQMLIFLRTTQFLLKNNRWSAQINQVLSLATIYLKCC